MKAGFGLVGVLVALGVIIWFWQSTGSHPADVVERSRPVRERAEQLAGQSGPDRVKASDTIKVTAVERGGRLHHLLVDEVTAEGAMEKFYGVRPADQIVKIGEVQLSSGIYDGEMAELQLLDAYQHSKPIEVIRDEKRIVLPATKGGPAGGNLLQR